MDSSGNIERLFLNLLEGNELTQEQLKVLNDWFATHPEEAGKYSAFKEIWSLSAQTTEKAASESETEFQRLEKRIFAKSEPEEKNERRLRLSVGMLAAAVVLGFIIAAGLLRVWDNRTMQKQNYIVDVPAGSRSDVLLPDGTRVTLNGESSITYNSGYGKRNRDVNLSGEAYFEVKHGAPHTFSVHSSDIVVSAHGTVFNVRAYPDDPSIETTLVNGSVSISVSGSKEEPVFLNPSEQLTWVRPSETGQNDGGRILISKGIDTGRYTSWINGRLHVQSESLADLSLKLERKYDVTILFAQPDLKELRFTGVLEDETIQQVLEVLKVTSNLNYIISGREITLFSTKEKPTP